MEIALRRAAVTEHRQHNAGVALQPQTPREPDRLRQLTRDRSLEREHFQIARHLEGDRVTDVPQKRELERIAMPQLTRKLTVLRHEPVGVRVERHRGADSRRLLTNARRERHHPALPLQAHAPLVEPPAAQHHAVALERHLVAHRLVLEQLTVLVEIPDQRRHRCGRHAIEVSRCGAGRFFHLSAVRACRAR